MSTKEASRRTPQDDAWSLRIKQRAGWKCEWCGLSAAEIKALGGELQAAHIAPRWDWPEKALEPGNGKALCTFKDPRHRHPQGKGHGFGCHNSMSGHWKSLNMPTGYERDGDRWKFAGVALLGIAGALVYAVLFAGWTWSWLQEAAWAAAGAMPFLSTKHRHGWAVFDLGTLLWLVLAGLNVLARYYWHVGVGASPLHVLLLAAMAAYVGSLILVHAALRRRWLSRAGRVLLHALVRLTRWAAP